MAKRRGNQEGSIYQRNSGTWQAQVSLNGHRLGKSFETRKEAAAWVTQMAAQQDRGLTFEGTKTTVREYLTQWLKDTKPTLRESTYGLYEGTVKRHITPAVGHIKLSGLTARGIQNLYTSKLEEGVGRRTVELIHAVLHRSLKFAVRQGLLVNNPAKDVQRPHHQAERMHILNEREIQRLLAFAAQTDFGALIQLAITTGLRKGELLGLKWTDIDWANATIRVERQLQRFPHDTWKFVKPKTKAAIRTVKVGATTLSALGRLLVQQQDWEQTHPHWNKEGVLFLSSTGTPKDPRNTIREFKALLKAADLPNIRFHDLRHTAASVMLMSNMPLMRVTRQLGHAKASTTLDIYGHLIPGLEKDAMERIEQLVLPTATQLQHKAGA